MNNQIIRTFPYSRGMLGLPAVISSLSLESVWGTFGGQGLTISCSNWISANRALFVPFRVNRPINVVSMFMVEGSVTGNLDLGIYTTEGVRLTSNGGTPTSGGSIPHIIPVSDTLLGPGTYMMAGVMDSGVAAGAYRQSTPVVACQMVGMAQMASAYPLPAAATLATITGIYLPIMGLLTETAFI